MSKRYPTYEQNRISLDQEVLNDPDILMDEGWHCWYKATLVATIGKSKYKESYRPRAIFQVGKKFRITMAFRSFGLGKLHPREKKLLQAYSIEEIAELGTCIGEDVEIEIDTYTLPNREKTLYIRDFRSPHAWG